MRRYLPVLAGALFLTGVLAGPAHAAQGEFSWTGFVTDGGFDNPADHVCHTIDSAHELPEHGNANNDTDSLALLYGSSDCQGDPHMAMVPGEEAEVIDDVEGVRFIPVP
ncbi:hypothetical protein [Streptomyces luteolus]|uniref:Secreted protein n=1 Tax=Streptomyces luteolus TaxID=3043615 RepID=A0ABT6SQE5_9ACTN|nr:hypothetical protein [Streptomyces sp. B-S-A12]MDI3417616.1 hypothetical protein [Streptomyces sp. B-S-A12]